MLERLKQLLGWGPPRDGWALLKHLGAREFVDWGHDGRALTAAWKACPRAEWLLEVANALQLDGALIERCMRACAARIDKRNRALRDGATELADRWQAAGSEPEQQAQTLDAFGRLLCRAIDENPRVKKAKQQEHRAGKHDAYSGLHLSDKEIAGWVAVDAVELSVMRGFAACVRQEISFDDIAEQVERRLGPAGQDHETGPYR